MCVCMCHCHSLVWAVTPSFDSPQPAFHYCKHTDMQMSRRVESLWTSGLCDGRKGQVNWTVIKLSLIVSAIQSSPGLWVVSREPHCTASSDNISLSAQRPDNSQQSGRRWLHFWGSLPAMIYRTPTRLCSLPDFHVPFLVLHTTSPLRQTPLSISCLFFPDFPLPCNSSLLLPRT